MRNIEMTKVLLVLYALSAFSIKVHSQDSTYLVEPGIHPAKVIPITNQLQYPKFLAGRIYLTTGKQTEVTRLNYNLLYDAILLAESNGDTVWLDKTIVEYVQIGSDVYFCHLTQGYFRLLTRDEHTKLMVKSIWIVAQKYPLHSHWAAIESPQKPMTADEFRFPSEYTRFAKARSYVFLGPRNTVYRPTKRSLMRAFPEEKKTIRNYLKKHKTDYASESQLRELVAFCNTLAYPLDYK